MSFSHTHTLSLSLSLSLQYFAKNADGCLRGDAHRGFLVAETFAHVDAAKPSPEAEAATDAIAALADDCSEQSTLNDGPAHRIIKRLLAESAGPLLAPKLLANMQGHLAEFCAWNRSAFVVVAVFESTPAVAEVKTKEEEG